MMDQVSVLFSIISLGIVERNNMHALPIIIWILCKISSGSWLLCGSHARPYVAFGSSFRLKFQVKVI